MFTAVLRISGLDLDVDALLGEFPLLRTEAVWRQGEPGADGRPHARSGLDVWVAEERDGRTLIDRILERLDLERGLLAAASGRAAALELAIVMLPAADGGWTPTLTLPPGPLRRIGEHGVTVHLTARPPAAPAGG